MKTSDLFMLYLLIVGAPHMSPKFALGFGIVCLFVALFSMLRGD